MSVELDWGKLTHISAYRAAVNHLRRENPELELKPQQLWAKRIEDFINCKITEVPFGRWNVEFANEDDLLLFLLKWGS